MIGKWIDDRLARVSDEAFERFAKRVNFWSLAFIIAYTVAWYALAGASLMRDLGLNPGAVVIASNGWLAVFLPNLVVMHLGVRKMMARSRLLGEQMDASHEEFLRAMHAARDRVENGPVPLLDDERKPH